MTKDTVIGVGVGLLIGWLLWRRRGLAAMLGAGSGGCGGCAGSGGGSGGCGQATSAGVGNYAQGSGPGAIPGF